MNNSELFLGHLNHVVGRPEDKILEVDSSDPAMSPVYVFVYRNWPEPGLFTGFTLGLSAANHPDWILGKSELMICIESDDEAWMYAIGYMAEKLRGKHPFSYGNTINFGGCVSDESALDAFLIFAPPFLTKDQMAVKLMNCTCYITGMYPLYASELPLYEELGLKKFWHLPGWDLFDVYRNPLTPPRA